MILAAGIWLLLTIGKGYIANATSSSQLGIDKSVVSSFDSMSLLLTIGIGALALLLIPFYFIKRAEEKKYENKNTYKNASSNV